MVIDSARDWDKNLFSPDNIRSESTKITVFVLDINLQFCTGNYAPKFND